MTNALLTMPCRYYRLYPAERPLGHATTDVSVDPAEAVLLLIDVYGGTAPDEDSDDLPETDLYATRAREHRKVILDAIVPAKQAGARAGVRCVYVTNQLSPGLAENHAWRQLVQRVHGFDVAEVWAPPTPILEFAPEIAPAPHEIVIPKQFYSGFFETSLDSCLRSLGARTIIAAGFDSRVCLGSTLMDAMYRSYQVIALRDAIRTYEYGETEDGGYCNLVAVRTIETLVGFTATTEEFVTACDRLAAAGSTA